MSRSITQPPPNSISPSHSDSSLGDRRAPAGIRTNNPQSPARTPAPTPSARTLQDFVLQRRDANRTVSCSSPASPDAPTAHRRRRYRPDLNRSSNPDRFASSSASYCAAVTPSTPAAASLRRPVGFAHPSIVNMSAPASSGSASPPSEPAPLSCRVEMTSRPNVPAICPCAQAPSSDRPLPSAGSSGHRVPRPHRYLSCRPSFSPPVARHFVSFAQHWVALRPFAPSGPDGSREPGPRSIAAPAPPCTVEKTRSPRFLDDPCVHAPLFEADPQPQTNPGLTM